MIKLCLLIAIPLLFSACKKDDDDVVGTYACVDGQCVNAYNAVTGQQIHVPEFLTMEDCNNVCVAD